MIPYQGCVVAPDGSLKALWQNDPATPLQEVPNSIVEDPDGTRRSRLSPDDVIVDLTTYFLGSEFQLLYRDWGHARARKDATGVWRFFLLLPTLQANRAGDGVERGDVFEDEHPIERVRAHRMRLAQATAERKLA